MRLFGRILPCRLRRPIAGAALLGLVVLAAELSVGAWPLLAAGVVVEAVLLGGTRSVALAAPACYW